MGRVPQGEEGYTIQVNTGAAVKKVENKKKTELQTNLDYHTAVREDGYKFDIDTMINSPGKIPRNMDVLREKYINKNAYTDKVDGLSTAIQGELVCYVDEKEILNKIVEKSNSERFQKGQSAEITLADVEKAYHDQDDINLNIMQTMDDMDDDLSIFDKYNRNLKAIKFLTKLKMLTELAEQINSENHKVSGPTTVDISSNQWEIARSYSVPVGNRYRDEIQITVKYEEDKENNTTKKIIKKTTTRYVQIRISEDYKLFDDSFDVKWIAKSLFDNFDIKKYENLFVANDYNFRDRIQYLKEDIED